MEGRGHPVDSHLQNMNVVLEEVEEGAYGVWEYTCNQLSNQTALLCCE